MDRTNDQPMAILRDPRSGQVRAILRDEDATSLMEGGAAATGSGVSAPTTLDAALGASSRLEVLFSRGIPGAAEWRR